MELFPVEQQEAVLRRQNKVSRARHAGRDAGDERFLRLARVRHPARDVDERRHVGIITRLGDHRSAVGVADEDDRIALLADDHLGRGDVVLERDGRVLHDPDPVAVLPQEVVDAPPAGSVRPSAVHEDYGGLGSILRVCAHGLLLSDPLFRWRVDLSTGSMVPPSALWRELRRMPIPRRWVNKALSDALGSLEWHPTLTACILSLHCDSAGLADKEEQSCHTTTRGLISPTRTMMPAWTSATCSPSLSRRTQAGPSSSWTCIRP